MCNTQVRALVIPWTCDLCNGWATSSNTSKGAIIFSKDLKSYGLHTNPFHGFFVTDFTILDTFKQKNQVTLYEVFLRIKTVIYF